MVNEVISQSFVKFLPHIESSLLISLPEKKCEELGRSLKAPLFFLAKKRKGSIYVYKTFESKN